jgi:hypothetical protein
MEELSVYGLIENLNFDNSTDKTLMIKEAIDSLDLFESASERSIKLTEIYKDYFNPKYAVSESNGKLYKAISTLIENKYKKQNAKSIVESYNVINDYISSVKTANVKSTELTESFKTDNNIEYKKLFPFIKKQSVDYYNSLELNENDSKLIDIMVNGSLNDKTILFESIKKQALTMIDAIDESDMTNELKLETIDKINSMDSNNENVIEENIMTLNELISEDSE